MIFMSKVLYLRGVEVLIDKVSDRNTYKRNNRSIKYDALIVRLNLFIFQGFPVKIIPLALHG